MTASAPEPVGDRNRLDVPPALEFLKRATNLRDRKAKKR